jgi:hypothetical protein
VRRQLLLGRRLAITAMGRYADPRLVVIDAAWTTQQTPVLDPC